MVLQVKGEEWLLVELLSSCNFKCSQQIWRGSVTSWGRQHEEQETGLTLNTVMVTYMADVPGNCSDGPGASCARCCTSAQINHTGQTDVLEPGDRLGWEAGLRAQTSVVTLSCFYYYVLTNSEVQNKFRQVLGAWAGT